MQGAGAATFVMSAPTCAQLPDGGLAELAIVGRSNVGKSSLLAAILGTDKLVRISRTPGRTQLLNMFLARGGILAWMDLPGYGYAKLAKTQRAQMSAMVRGYLAERRQLRGVVLLVDARRDGASPLDIEMAAWILRCRRPMLVVATKADLVPKTRRQHHIRRIEEALGTHPGDALALSSRTGEGLTTLMERVHQLTAAPAP